MSKMLGIDLNVDNEYMEQVVKDTVLLGISEALEEKNHIVQNLVDTVLNVKVDEQGRPARASYDQKYTLLEYHVRKLLEEETKAQINNLLEEKRPLVREKIRKALQEKKTLDRFTDNFMKVVGESLESKWKTKIDINFEQYKSDY